MRRFLLGAAVAALVLGLASRTEAAGRGGPGHGGGHGWSYGQSSYSHGYGQRDYGHGAGSGSVSKGYHLRYGHKFSHGYYYRGRDHHHWTHRRYWAKYRTTCYWDPGTRCWYYWCPSRACYYPVGYIAVEPPAVEEAPPDGAEPRPLP
jgi:opacity protein-like surface antigen